MLQHISLKIITLISLLLFGVFSTTSFAQSAISGILEADTTLDSKANPWSISADIIIPDQVTLTIEPGTHLYFAPGAGIVVQLGGQLLAEGNEQNRILFSSPPDSNSQWNGIEFNQTQEDNRLCYIDMINGDGASRIIDVYKSRLLIDHVTWDSTNTKVIELRNPSIVIRGSTFPAVNSQEAIHGSGLTSDEYCIIKGNIFDKPTGYNDVIDFSGCKRPGPILQVIDNVFLGGDDDGLDLDGCDAHIEGNSFINFHKRDNSNSSTSNAIATGSYNGLKTDIVVVRNIFYDNDHAVLLKQGAFLKAENNVFVNNSNSAINFSEYPFRSVSPGKGATVDGCIFWNNNEPFGNQFAQPGEIDPEIIVHRSIIKSDKHDLGEGNLDVDPKFIDETSNFHLAMSSPAIGKGPNGLDMGAYVAAGASISGEPDSITNKTDATLTIGGPGITHYTYSINDTSGPWGEEISLADSPQIQLAELADGQSVTVYVKGKNSANVWQHHPDFTTSKTWKVDVTYTTLDTENTHSTDLPKIFLLHQNFPNPFNQSTQIIFELPESAELSVIIYDLLGRKVRTLTNGTHKAGILKLKWDAKKNSGEYVSSGVYFVQVRANKNVFSRKMLLIQ